MISCFPICRAEEQKTDLKSADAAKAKNIPGRKESMLLPSSLFFKVAGKGNPYFFFFLGLSLREKSICSFLKGERKYGFRRCRFRDLWFRVVRAVVVAKMGIVQKIDAEHISFPVALASF